MLTAIELVHTAVLERYVGDSAAGATYDAPVNVLGYFEGGSQHLEQPVTSEAGAIGKFYTNESDLPIGSRLNVNGVAGYVGEVLVLSDFGGMDHTEVTVTAVPRDAEYRTATVSLLKPGAAAWSDDDEATTYSDGAVYATSIAARIEALILRKGDADREVAEETLTTATYRVTVFHDFEPFEHDEVRVDTCPADGSLVGRRLQIIHVLRGTQVFERQLICNLADEPRPT